MGDGADKVLDVCEKKGIKVSGVFSSDGFRHGKVFRGFSVETYSDIRERLGDVIVLVCFATCLPEVLENIYRIENEVTTYCPDVPVFGNGLFDESFVKEHFGRFKNVYERLSDETSKKCYLNVILAKLTGEMKYLRECETEVSEAYKNIIKPKPDGHYIDVGAYNGDTIREYLSFSGTAKTITAFEPDVRNYRKLVSFGEENALDISRFHNIAAWDKSEELTFFSRSGRNSAGTTNHKSAKSVVIAADRADNYIKDGADFINIDAEGSDAKVISGLSGTIREFSPVISCAVYHRNEDMFAIPEQLMNLYGKSRVHMRHFRYVPAWDTNVYISPVQN